MSEQRQVYSPIIWVAHESDLSGANLSLLEFMQELRDAGAKQLLVVNLKGPMSAKAISLGFEVEYIKFYGWVRGLNEPFFNHHFLKRQFRNTVAFFQFLRLYHSYQPQLVVSFTSTIYISSLAAFFYGVRVYRRISEFGKKDFGFRFAWGRWAYSFMNLVSAKILVNSRAVYNQYRKHIRPDKLAVVYNSVKLNRIVSPRETVMDPRYPRLLLMGQVLPSKGHMDALGALICLKKRDIYPRLTIVGARHDIPYEEKMFQFIESNGLQDQVTFLDYSEDRETLFETHDIVLMCSLNEAFGRVTAEAMKAFTPVIGVNTGGTPELVLNESTGLLYSAGNVFELADKIETYCTAKINTDILIQNAYLHVQKLTAKEQRLKFFYRSVYLENSKPLILWQAHESGLTGANIAMLEYIDSLSESYSFHVIVPHPGGMCIALEERNIPHTVIMQYGWVNYYKLDKLAKIKMSFRSFIALQRIRNLIRKLSPVFVFTNTQASFIAAKAAYKEKVPHVWWIHEFGQEDFGFSIGLGNKKNVYSFMHKWSRGIICNSKAVAEKFLKLMPHSNILVNYQPVSWKHINEVAVKKGKFLMFGQISPTKGHMEVIDAMIQCRRQNRILPALHIIGPCDNDEYYNAIVSKVKNSGLEDWIKIEAGFFEKEYVIPQYEVLLVASKSEAFGRVIVEACKAGLRVVVKNSGGAPELLNKTNGLLYNNKEELVSILCGESQLPNGPVFLNYDEKVELSRLKDFISEIN